MSVYRIIYRDGKKVMLPVKDREEYLALRDSEQNRRAEKHKMLQCNYSCLPNEDGLLRGSKTPSDTVGMDVDFDPSDPDYEQKMAELPERILAKKEEVGLLMLEKSASKGYHLVFTRRPELTQEENLRWASEVLGVKYDEGAKDITRVFFTPADKLVYLDDEIFRTSPTRPSRPSRPTPDPRPTPNPSREGRGVVTTAAEAPAESHAAETTAESRTTETTAEVITPLPSREGLGVGLQGQGVGLAPLRAFDLCVAEAGLDVNRMDVWGEHNWHTNLMSVLSVGLPKLMPKNQLLAVVAERLPNYSQTADCRALIDYFYEKYAADKGYMSLPLRNINAKAQQPLGEVAGAGSDAENDALMGTMLAGWNPPPLPKKMARLIWLLIKPFPEQYHPMLTVSAMVLLGTLAGHFRATYLDGRIVAANLYAALIAGSGKGKNWVTMLFDIVTSHTLKSWDDAEWAKVYENALMREKMANSKDRPAKYRPKLRIMETMSKTSLLEIQTNLGENGMVLCKYSESDELANSSRAAFSNISVLLRKAWDLDMHRQYYVSEASCNTQCRLNAAILLTGTPKSVLSRLFSDTENGMMQRFIPMIMPKLKRTFRPPVYSPLTADEEAERDALLMQLWQKDLSLGDQTLMLEMPRTRHLIEQWYDALEERYNDGLVSEAEADLSHRVGQFMQRAAIPFVALYGEESREMLELIRWLGDFSYYNICHLFGMRVTEDLKTSEEMLTQHQDSRRTAEPLLSKLPEVFTVQQMQELREREGQSADVRMLLSRYCKNGKLIKMGRGVYKKVQGIV